MKTLRTMGSLLALAVWLLPGAATQSVALHLAVEHAAPSAAEHDAMHEHGIEHEHAAPGHSHDSEGHDHQGEHHEQAARLLATPSGAGSRTELVVQAIEPLGRASIVLPPAPRLEAPAPVARTGPAPPGSRHTVLRI